MNYTERELQDMFDAFLDENSLEIIIGTLIYSPSEVLKAVDPIAYKEEYFNWLNQEVEEGRLDEDILE
jgi:hypothetical protein